MVMHGEVWIHDPVHWTWLSDKAKAGDINGFEMQKRELEKSNPGSGMIWISNHKGADGCMSVADDSRKYAQCVISMLKLQGQK